MKFYDCVTAPSPRRVRIFAAEKGMALDTVQVDLANGEQFSDEFRRINPDCMVPVLELDDGTLLSEVVAICQYLEELQPEPSLFGSTPVERALVTMWNAKIEQQGFLAIADAFRNSAKGLKKHAMPGPDSFEQIPELANRGRERVQLFFNKLDSHLSGKDFIVGEKFSIADISAFVAVDFVGWIKMAIPDDATSLARWYASVSARPSAHA
jgi:glutathione S-transferase